MRFFAVEASEDEKARMGEAGEGHIAVRVHAKNSFIFSRIALRLRLPRECIGLTGLSASVRLPSHTRPPLPLPPPHAGFFLGRGLRHHKSVVD